MGGAFFILYNVALRKMISRLHYYYHRLLRRMLTLMVSIPTFIVGTLHRSVILIINYEKVFYVSTMPIIHGI
jgi:hypothetical protein